MKEDFTNRMKEMLGSEYGIFVQAFTDNGVHTGIRVSASKKGAEAAVLKAAGELEPVPWCKHGFYADKSVLTGNHPYHMAGLFYFQEPSAMSVVDALDIQKGDYVLDLCAAPGGKATQAGSILAGSGLLVANEIIPKRASVLAENIERFGLSNVLVTNETPKNLADRFISFFDKIIVDAPCSGEGMFRKEPQAVEEWSMEHTLSCAVRSRNILDSAVRMLKSGGYLVYSTCTFAPCENEGTVAYLLEQYPEFELCEIKNLSMAADGKAEYIGAEADLSKTKRIFPHKNRGEGHFVALFKKNGYKDTLSCEKKQNTRHEKIDEWIYLYREFEQKTLNTIIDGRFTMFGDHLYRIPDGIDTVEQLKIARCGLYLGVCKKGRFEPSHALCLALKREDFKHTIDFPYDSISLKRYLMGETMACDEDGWVAVTVDGYPIGFGKANGGILKNHFPKHLRLKK